MPLFDFPFIRSYLLDTAAAADGRSDDNAAAGKKTNAIVEKSFVESSLDPKLRYPARAYNRSL